jgi:hypothetical protein
MNKVPIPIIVVVFLLGADRLFELFSDLFLVSQVKIYWYLLILLLNAGTVYSLFMTYKLRRWAPFTYVGAYAAIPFINQLAGATIYHAWIWLLNPLIYLCCVMPFWKKLIWKDNLAVQGTARAEPLHKEVG